MFTKLRSAWRQRQIRKTREQARTDRYAKHGAAHMTAGERQRVFRNRPKPRG